MANARWDEQKLLKELASAGSTGATLPTLIATGWPKQSLMTLANKLKLEGKLTVHQRTTGEIALIVMEAPRAGSHGVGAGHGQPGMAGGRALTPTLAALTVEQQAVYTAVDAAGTNGIAGKSICDSVKLPVASVSKHLKMLEHRQLVKWFHSFNSKTKKLYILFGREPSAAVTGGALFKDGSIDEGAISKVKTAIVEFFASGRLPSVGESRPMGSKDSSSGTKDGSDMDEDEMMDDSPIIKTEISSKGASQSVETDSAFQDLFGDSAGPNSNGPNSVSSTGKRVLSSVELEHITRALGSTMSAVNQIVQTLILDGQCEQVSPGKFTATDKIFSAGGSSVAKRSRAARDTSGDPIHGSMEYSSDASPLFMRFQESLGISLEDRAASIFSEVPWMCCVHSSMEHLVPGCAHKSIDVQKIALSWVYPDARLSLDSH